MSKVKKLLYAEFCFDGFGNSYEAFKNIGRGGAVFESKGLLTTKMMGTGSGNGFSVIPDFKRYALLFFFDSEKSVMAFINSNSLFNWYLTASNQHLVTLLNPVNGHGKWGGDSTFEYERNAMNQNQPIAVITRATIRTSRLVEFWWNVPKVSRFMQSTDAVHQVGIGEYPIFMQATFSIWTNRKALVDAAYRDTVHAEIVKKTRDRNWYKEELFAEFMIDSASFSGNLYSRLSKFDLQPLL